MSTPGRPEGEYRSATHEGGRVSTAGGPEPDGRDAYEGDW